MTHPPHDRSCVYPLGPLDRNLPYVFRAQHLLFRGEDADIPLLRTSLDKLLASTPFLAGTVTFASTPGWLQVSAPYVSADDVLTVVDKRNVLDYEESRARGFPASDFPDGAGFDPAPYICPPPAPVFRAQVNLVRGGVVFSVFLHHATFDAQGCATVLRAWATICRTGVPQVLLDVDRAPLALSAARGAGKLDDHPCLGICSVDMPPVSLVPAKGAMWYFSEDQLARLKADASEGLDDGEWISTHHAICALLWTRVTTARRKLGVVEDTATVGLYNAADSRKRVSPNVSEAFTGNSTVMVGAHASVVALVLAYPDSKLSTFAKLVRDSIDVGATDISVRDLLAVFSHFSDDLRAVGWKWENAHSTAGLLVTSWARLDTYDLDWGTAFRRCDRIRHPWAVLPNFAMTMPVGANGHTDEGMEVLVSLPLEEMDIFERDEWMAMYAERVY